jgi:uncharacterized membrane protein (UPF0127 family)
VILHRSRKAAALALAALFVATACLAQTAALIDLATLARTPLEVQSGSHRHVFDVWVAATPAQQEQGLMFVRDLPAERGMLFINSEPRTVTMWMKNTYIELDMLFVAADGRIARIAERTHPHSLAVISSGVPIIAVVEIKGGESARLGLHAGDRVSWLLPRSP